MTTHNPINEYFAGLNESNAERVFNALWLILIEPHHRHDAATAKQFLRSEGRFLALANEAQSKPSAELRIAQDALNEAYDEAGEVDASSDDSAFIALVERIADLQTRKVEAQFQMDAASVAVANWNDVSKGALVAA